MREVSERVNVAFAAEGFGLGEGAEGAEHFDGAFHAGGDFDAAVEVEAVGVAVAEDAGDVFGFDAAGEDPGVGEVQGVELVEVQGVSGAALAAAPAVEQVVGAVGGPGVDVLLQFVEAVVLGRPEDADDALGADGVGVFGALVAVQLGVVEPGFFHGAQDAFAPLADEDADSLHVGAGDAGGALRGDAAGALAVEDEADEAGSAGGGAVDAGGVGLAAGFDEGGAAAGCAVTGAVRAGG